MARVALAWAASQPGMTSPILGARTPEQLRENLEALDTPLSPEHLRALNETSKLDPAFPDSIFTPEIRRGIFGGSTVHGWH